jgi:peptide/nickel transport system permease protein
MATLAPGGPGGTSEPGQGTPTLMPGGGVWPTGGLPEGGISGVRSLRRMTRAIRSNGKASVGTGLLALFCLVAIFPGVIAHDNPSAEVYGRALGPSAQHLLGTTAFGQDIFAQVIYGTRPVVLIAFGVGLSATVIAMLIGVAAAYLGGA